YQFVGPIADAPSFYERWIAYRSVLEEYEIAYEQHPQLIGPEAGDGLWKVIPKVLDEIKPDVFVCVNDITAVIMIEGIRQKGLAVPADCAVTGFDNTHEPGSESGGVGLTTIDVNKELMGRRAVDK